MLEKLAEHINKTFTPTFGFPKDFIDARYHNGVFTLRIGARDFSVYDDGEFMGCGTNMVLLQKWIVAETKDRRKQGEIHGLQP